MNDIQSTPAGSPLAPGAATGSPLAPGPAASATGAASAMGAGGPPVAEPSPAAGTAGAAANTANTAAGTPLALAAVDNVMRSLVGSIEDKHIAAAAERVAAQRARQPLATPDQLAAAAIRQKCIDTGAVGLASSLPGLIPGAGSMLVVSAGLMVDLRKTMEMQKELVLELAAIYGRPVTPADRRNLLLLVTGVDSGNKLIAKAGSEAAAKVTTRLSSKALSKALPVAGIVTSAAVNVVSTYLVGRRAQAYLAADPALAEDWDDALRTLSGVDERELLKWLLASLDQAQGGLAGALGRAGGAVSGAVSGAGSALGSAGRGLAGAASRVVAGGRQRLRRRGPADSQPTDMQPTVPTGGQLTGGQLTGGQPASGQPTSGQPTSGQPASGQPTSGPRTGGQPTGRQPTGGQPPVPAA